MEKYEKARRLKKCIAKIRKDYTENLKAKDMFTRQRSTAMWVIDVLALRVGNEKGEDEADTVGCCSLRVEHASFQNDANQCALTLSFLGKDSMPYNNTIELSQYGAVGALVYANLQSFCAQKEPQEGIFDELSVTELNKHLSSLMPGLSAKVFRTFNASVTLEKELPPDEACTHDDVQRKIVAYNEANRKVAILCNHQRTVPKGFDATMERNQVTLAQLKAQVKELYQMKSALKKNKTSDIVLKQEHCRQDDHKTTAKKEVDGRNSQSHKHHDSGDDAKAQAHRFVRMPTIDQVEKKIASWEKKIKALDLRLKDKVRRVKRSLGYIYIYISMTRVL
jgi:DNA topoisomerase-1